MPAELLLRALILLEIVADLIRDAEPKLASSAHRYTLNHMLEEQGKHQIELAHMRGCLRTRAEALALAEKETP